jgi:hypothetical protein
MYEFLVSNGVYVIDKKEVYYNPNTIYEEKNLSIELPSVRHSS